MNLKNIDEIREKVIDLIENQSGVDRNLIVGSAKFAEDLQFDSLDGVEFIMSIEEMLGFEISDEEADIDTFRGINISAQDMAMKLPENEPPFGTLDRFMMLLERRLKT